MIIRTLPLSAFCLLLTACPPEKGDTGATTDPDPIDTSVTDSDPPLDGDGDGLTAADGDCDDADPAVRPGTPEVCNGEDDNCNVRVDEGFGDGDSDGIADCLDIEGCDGVDNDGDGLVDEGMPDTDRDGIVDCQDREECDGLDNDGDGEVDEGSSDTDGDGTADCIDFEDCDGLDNDGDGATDEGYADTDGDGTADCVDREICNCEDDDGDGTVDDGITCSTYDVTISLSADDQFELWLDGASLGGNIGWGTRNDYTVAASPGIHQFAVYAEDVGNGAVGFNASIDVPGWGASDWNTGLGAWWGSNEDPAGYGASATWTTQGYSALQPDSVALATSCFLTWGSPSGIGPSGGQWVWFDNCYASMGDEENWYVVEIDVCPAVSDMDGDGFAVGEDCDDSSAAVYPGRRRSATTGWTTTATARRTATASASTRSSMRRAATPRPPSLAPIPCCSGRWTA